jgi:type I site-specific restriction-modification system R (restriction) subunit
MNQYQQEQHASGYRTEYFWEEVLARDSFLDILGHFMFIERKEEKVDDGQGVAKAFDQDSKQLAAALIDGTKIVITTLQKFPFVLRGLLHAAGAESREKATADEKRQAKEIFDAIRSNRETDSNGAPLG